MSSSTSADSYFRFSLGYTMRSQMGSQIMAGGSSVFEVDRNVSLVDDDLNNRESLPQRYSSML